MKYKGFTIYRPDYWIINSPEGDCIEPACATLEYAKGIVDGQIFLRKKAGGKA